MSHTITINGQVHTTDVDGNMPLLWFLRDTLELTGTKYGCGMGLCGACTVHLDGDAVQSCLVTVSEADGKAVTTIEGLSEDGSHPLQIAWLKQQCLAMRLLPARPDHGGRGSVETKPRTQRRGYRCGHGRQTSVVAVPTYASARPSPMPLSR